MKTSLRIMKWRTSNRLVLILVSSRSRISARNASHRDHNRDRPRFSPFKSPPLARKIRCRADNVLLFLLRGCRDPYEFPRIRRILDHHLVFYAPSVLFPLDERQFCIWNALIMSKTIGVAPPIITVYVYISPTFPTTRHQNFPTRVQ